MGRARRAVAVAAAAALAAGAACSAGQEAVDPLPPPPSTQARPPTTPAPDYTDVQLPPVGGRTTTTSIAVGPGQASLNGMVLAPDGSPAASVTVRIERVAGGAVATTDLATGADGHWTLPGVLGGRYRVRAWRAPDLAMVQPAVVFVGATDTVPVEVKLERNFGTTPVLAIAPNPPQAGVAASLVVQVSSRVVQLDGQIHGTPMVAVGVALDPSGGWFVGQPNPALTDGTGRVRWEVVCKAQGAQPLRLLVGAEPFQLALPPCGAPPLPPTTPSSTVPGATTTTKPGTPTTTRPATTTSTTRR